MVSASKLSSMTESHCRHTNLMLFGAPALRPMNTPVRNRQPAYWALGETQKWSRVYPHLQVGVWLSGFIYRWFRDCVGFLCTEPDIPQHTGCSQTSPVHRRALCELLTVVSQSIGSYVIRVLGSGFWVLGSGFWVLVKCSISKISSTQHPVPSTQHPVPSTQYQLTSEPGN